MAIRWGSYKVKGFYDELIRVAGKPRFASAALCEYLRNLKDKEIEEYKSAAEMAIHVMGITFTVYTEEEGSIDRAWPFDIIPRVI
ncbi:MAG TPA: circularly permuted type 2 ATP-grasp protein, partial [Gammaproteobacteria bacterium]